jgi:hypothetical protein
MKKTFMQKMPKNVETFKILTSFLRIIEAAIKIFIKL